MSPHSAVIRHAQQLRAAERAAVAGARLNAGQITLAVAACDAAARKLSVLTAESSRIAEFARQPDVSEHELKVAARRLAEIDAQCARLSVRYRELGQHPQVNSAILAREAARRAQS
jgi:hypothetical protein